MTGTTVSSSVTTGLTLTGTSQNPVSVTSAGYVNTSAGDGVYSKTAIAWNIINAGKIKSTKTGGGGVVLKQGGTVANGTGALVSGSSFGVYIAGNYGGSVTNSGTIKATASTGVGVRIAANNATLVNAGSIAAASASKTAVSFSGSGDVLVLDSGFSVTGKVLAIATDTLELASNGSTGTVSGLGTNITGFGTTTIDAGGVWTATGTLSGSVTIAGTLNAKPALLFTNANIVNAGVIRNGYLNLFGGSDTLTNNGTISGTASAIGLYNGAIVNNATILSTAATIGGAGVLSQGGTLTNSSNGVITGFAGVYVQGTGVMTVVNAGTIIGSGTYGWGAVGLRDGGSVFNATSGFLQGYMGVGFQALGTLINQGTITGVGAGSAEGVYLGYGGVVSNAVGGTICGPVGVQIGSHAPGTLFNTGTITGSMYGVELQPGATVINSATGANAGYIGSANTGVLAINGGPVTISNTGTIEGAGSSFISAGIYLANAVGTITNGASDTGAGLIQGNQYGVLASYQSLTLSNFATIAGTVAIEVRDTISGTPANNTVINAGTIESSDGVAGTAVQFGGGNDRLVIDGGAVFVGKVDGGGGSDTLELAAGGSGTVYGFGSDFTNFATLTVDAGAQWTLTGSTTLMTGTTVDFAGNTGLLQFAPGVMAGTIDGFTPGDTIGLTGVTDATGAYVVNSHTIEVARANNAPTYLALDPTQDLTNTVFHVATQGGNAEITATDPACFAEGTHIETPNGPVAVEALHVGDLVCTAAGGVRPIQWIGFRRIDLARHPEPARVRPLRIKADAFADGVPCRDLRLSPDHAVLLGGVLMPIRLLRNNGSILRDEDCPTATYYHVELDTHDILLAEQLPAESYLDTGNRGMFENADMPFRLHADFANDQARRETESCALFATDPALVEPVWRRLAVRAEQLGHHLPEERDATEDPALCVVAGARTLRPLANDGGHYVFMLPAGAHSVRLVTRSVVPCEQRPWLEDRRSLGVMVGRMTLRGPDCIETIAPDHPSLSHGWWEVEREAGRIWRWTNGDATLAVPGDAPAILEVELAGTLAYPLPRPAPVEPMRVEPVRIEPVRMEPVRRAA